MKAGQKRGFAIAVTTAFAIVVSFMGISAAHAQSPSVSTAPTLAFEVATIKPNAQGFIDMGGGVRVLSGRTHCHGIDTRAVPSDPIPLPALGRCVLLNSTLKEAINVAYGLRLGLVRSKVNQLIVGGPGWASTDPFDIEAKAEDVSTTTEAQLLSMLQTLLQERFKLEFHRETREVSGFALLIAKKGPKLKEATPEEKSTFSMLPGIQGQNVGIGSLVDTLAIRLGRIVTDKTGLNGHYDFSLTWTPDENQFVANGVPFPARTPLSDDSGPTLTTALQEQLGLRLESQKVSMDVLVIDNAVKLSEPGGNQES